MIDLLKLHERTAANFETGEVLNSAYEVTENRKINDISALEFDYPADEKGRMIAPNMLISCGGRLYEVLKIKRTMDGTDTFHIAAEGIFSYRAKKAFIPTMGDLMGKKPSYVLNQAVGEVTGFSLFTESELNERGMTWIDSGDFLIDVFSVDKVSLWDYIQDIIENCGRGELYNEGLKFALVKRIGRDNGVRISLTKNAQNISIERNTEELVTRLYPFGSNDLHIKSVNGGKAYIESPNITAYGVYEGYKDYSDYVEPEDILANAQWEFSEENEERIDVPKITITGKIIDLSKLSEYGELEKIELGDTVHVIDNDGAEHKERVIEMLHYPFEPKQTTISIGHMRQTFTYTLYQLRKNRRAFERVKTTGGGVAASKLSGYVDTDNNAIQSENELLKIIGDLLTIYNENGRARLKLGNDGGQFILSIYDENENLRIKLGDHGGSYAFAIYDRRENPAIYMDEDGNIVVAGRIKTHDETIVGSNLVVGENTSSGRIDFAGMINASEGSIEVVDHEMIIRADNIKLVGNVNINDTPVDL